MSPIVPDPREEEVGRALGTVLGIGVVFGAAMLAVLSIISLIGYIIYRCIYG